MRWSLSGFLALMVLAGCATVPPSVPESRDTEAYVAPLPEQLKLEVTEFDSGCAPAQIQGRLPEVPLGEALAVLLSDAGFAWQLDASLEALPVSVASPRPVPVPRVLARIIRKHNLRVVDNFGRVELLPEPQGYFQLDFLARSPVAARSSGALIEQGVEVQADRDDRLDDIWEQIRENLQTMAGEDADISVNAWTGQIDVHAAPDRLARVRTYLRDIERSFGTPIQIEVRILQVNLYRERQQGIDYSALASLGDGFEMALDMQGGSLERGGALAGGALPAMTAGGTLGLFRPERLAVFLRFLERQGEVRTLSAPSLTTLDNVSASISSLQHYPYRVSTIEGVGDEREVRTSYDEVRLGVHVALTPRLASDGSLSLEIVPQIADIAEERIDPLTGAPARPRTISQSLRTILRLRPGWSAFIGGLIHERRSEGRDGLPQVARWADALTGVRQQAKRRQELILVITPRVGAVLDASRVDAGGVYRRVQELLARSPLVNLPLRVEDCRSKALQAAQLAEPFYAYACEAYRERDYRRARHALERAQGFAPAHSQLLILEALIDWQTGQPARARRQLDRIEGTSGALRQGILGTAALMALADRDWDEAMALAGRLEPEVAPRLLRVARWHAGERGQLRAGEPSRE